MSAPEHELNTALPKPDTGSRLVGPNRAVRKSMGVGAALVVAAEILNPLSVNVSRSPDSQQRLSDKSSPVRVVDSQAGFNQFLNTLTSRFGARPVFADEEPQVEIAGVQTLPPALPSEGGEDRVAEAESLPAQPIVSTSPEQASLDALAAAEAAEVKSEKERGFRLTYKTPSGNFFLQNLGSGPIGYKVSDETLAAYDEYFQKLGVSVGINVAEATPEELEKLKTLALTPPDQRGVDMFIGRSCSDQELKANPDCKTSNFFPNYSQTVVLADIPTQTTTATVTFLRPDFKLPPEQREQLGAQTSGNLGWGIVKIKYKRDLDTIFESGDKKQLAEASEITTNMRYRLPALELIAPTK